MAEFWVCRFPGFGVVLTPDLDKMIRTHEFRSESKWQMFTKCYEIINSCGLQFKCSQNSCEIKILKSSWNCHETRYKQSRNLVDAMASWTCAAKLVFGNSNFWCRRGATAQCGFKTSLEYCFARKSRGGSRWVQARQLGSLGLGLLVGKLRLVLAQCLIISLETFHQISKTKRIANYVHPCWFTHVEVVCFTALVNAWWFDWWIDVWYFVLRCCIVAFLMIVPWWRLFFHLTFSAEKAAVFSRFASVLVLDSSCDFETTSSTVLRRLAKCSTKLWKFAARHEIATMTTRLETWNLSRFTAICFDSNFVLLLEKIVPFLLACFRAAHLK